MLREGQLIPHINVATIDGGRFAYSGIWQRKNVVVVSLPHQESTANDKYLSQLTSYMSELTGDDTACVITTDEIPDVPAPGVVFEPAATGSRIALAPAMNEEQS